MSQPNITLHYIPLQASRADRLFWLLEELELKYDVQAHPFVGPTSPGMRKVSRLGKTPALEIDGRVITETGFIVHYLLSRFPHAGLERTPSEPSFFWSHFSEGSMMLHLQPGRVLGIAQGALPKKPGVTADQAQGIDTLGNWLRNGWVKKNVTLQLAEIEDFLATNTNFSGTDLLGEGDFMLAYPINSMVHTAAFGKYDVGPKTLAWLERMRARPAWGRAVARQEKEGKAAEEKAKAEKAQAKL